MYEANSIFHHASLSKCHQNVFLVVIHQLQKQTIVFAEFKLSLF